MNWASASVEDVDVILPHVVPWHQTAPGDPATDGARVLTSGLAARLMVVAVMLWRAEGPSPPCGEYRRAGVCLRSLHLQESQPLVNVDLDSQVFVPLALPCLAEQSLRGLFLA